MEIMIRSGNGSSLNPEPLGFDEKRWLMVYGITYWHWFIYEHGYLNSK
jgi:hypothetical protein